MFVKIKWTFKIHWKIQKYLPWLISIWNTNVYAALELRRYRVSEQERVGGTGVYWWRSAIELRFAFSRERIWFICILTHFEINKWRRWKYVSFAIARKYGISPWNNGRLLSDLWTLFYHLIVMTFLTEWWCDKLSFRFRHSKLRAFLPFWIGMRRSK